MNRKHKRQVPRLDRRNAIKNIDYDASRSPYSSFPPSFAGHSVRSLGLNQLADRTSFRIKGIEGEFDLICQSLGLSGPEDFAIPADAWEARKVCSPSDSLPSSSRSFDHLDLDRNLDGSELDCSGSSYRARVCDESADEADNGNLEHGLSEVRSGARVLEKEGFEQEVDKFELSRRNRRYGFVGVRPLGLSPPMLIVDNSSSTWDIVKGFGPSDDEDLVSCSPAYSNTDDSKQVDEEGNIVRNVEPTEDGLGDGPGVAVSTLMDESSSDSNDEDLLSSTTHLVHSISPNASFRCSIKSWQKGDFLGSGSFGTVYEGFTDDGFFFAVKEVSLNDPGSQGQQSIYQLEQEISLLKQFQHENIVQYLGTDKDDSRLYIFLELVTKGSLASLYRKYHLHDSQVSSYTRQILNGLNYLHSRNVVHRDIKCANILVDTSGSVKLADFGLAKATVLNDIKSCKGTACWMAPEVVNGKSKGYGLAADIWSLGCTVLEMLTGQIPYSHLEGMQALFQIGKGVPPPVPSSLSKDALDFILQCIQVNPEYRPSATQLLAHPFVRKPRSTFTSPTSSTRL